MFNNKLKKEIQALQFKIDTLREDLNFERRMRNDLIKSHVEMKNEIKALLDHLKVEIIYNTRLLVIKKK